jgi:hypothetical protein
MRDAGWSGLIVSLLAMSVLLSQSRLHLEIVPEKPIAKTNELDRDRDGIPDELEQQLAEKFAPVIYYTADEPNLPTNVLTFLSQTSLWFFDKSCRPEGTLAAGSVSPAIPRLLAMPCATGSTPTDSYGTRSTGKERTFYLANVNLEQQRGSQDSREWTTYYHTYLNDSRGITIQYWRFYSYNTGEFWGHRAWVGCHGGDWEAVQIVLGPGPDYLPRFVDLLGHKNITRKLFSAAQHSGNHILIQADKGGHTSLLFEDTSKEGGFIRHDSWTRGGVRWPSGKTTAGSALLNLGEKLDPMPGMEFLRYSGLWGTRESSGWFSAQRSGYWGPAFNETGMGPANFITAWCFGIADANRGGPDLSGKGFVRECYPTEVNP